VPLSDRTIINQCIYPPVKSVVLGNSLILVKGIVLRTIVDKLISQPLCVVARIYKTLAKPAYRYLLFSQLSKSSGSLNIRT